MEFCTTHKWENADDFTVQGRQKDLLITVDVNGTQHSLLRGKALERQRQRTPEPGTRAIVPVESAPIAMPIPTAPTPIAPLSVETAPQTPVFDALLEVTDDEIEEWKAAIEDPPTSESEEVWTPDCENDWYVGYVTKFDENYWFVKLEGADTADERYKVYVHSSVVAEGFGRAIVGTKIRLRLTPNRKDSGCLWEAIEAQIEDLPAQDAEEN